MLERIGTLWRRILKSEQTGAETFVVISEDDRRAWSRYSAHAETTVHLVNSEDSTRHPAKVRNISQGGINLLVGKEFETGQLLSLELPTASKKGTFTVLMCVVHVAPAGGNLWTIGGTFSRELSDDDMEAIGVRKKRAGESDKRNWERYPCSLKATYSVVTAAEPTMYDATVLNISASGVGLAVNRSVETGTLLSVDLMNGSGHIVRTILACVVHASSWQEDRWALGCNFIRQLNEDDLKALI